MDIGYLFIGLSLDSRRSAVVRLRRSNNVLMLKGAAHFMNNTFDRIAWLQSSAVSGGVDAPSRSAPVAW
jgi:hypothetical protein